MTVRSVSEITRLMPMRIRFCRGKRQEFENQFRWYAQHYPSWVRGVQSAEMLVMPMLSLLTRMPWTMLQRQQAEVLIPYVREMRSAYVRLGQLNQEAVAARDAFRGANLAEQAVGLDRLVADARRELELTGEQLRAWNTSGLPGASPADTPRWLAYLTPIHLARWHAQVATEYAPEIRAAVTGPVRQREPRPRAPTTTGMTDQDKGILAALAVAGVLLLRRRQKAKARPPRPPLPPVR
jgi:MYXO-CTERM domain-containing protein